MLSGTELDYFFIKNDTPVRIYRYIDIPSDFDIDDLIDQKYIILYPSRGDGGELTPNQGHYIGLWGISRGKGMKDDIYFFDSYGNLPDMQVMDTNAVNHYNTLIKLMEDNHNEYNIHFNPHRFQYDDFSCGYWVAVRLMLAHLNEKQFKDFIETVELSPVQLYAIFDNYSPMM